MKHTARALFQPGLILIARDGYEGGSEVPAMSELARKECVPCKGGIPPLTGEEIAELTPEVPEWSVVDEHHILRTFRFPDFALALAFTNRVGELAEEQGHHPDILLAWGKVEVTIWTHKINGLTVSDFVLAAKIDELPRPQA
jgi:4a-hydroxytetrahydrobiopterin dehydratase